MNKAVRKNEYSFRENEKFLMYNEQLILRKSISCFEKMNMILLFKIFLENDEFVKEMKFKFWKKTESSSRKNEYSSWGKCICFYDKITLDYLK